MASLWHLQPPSFESFHKSAATCCRSSFRRHFSIGELRSIICSLSTFSQHLDTLRNNSGLTAIYKSMRCHSYQTRLPQKLVAYDRRSSANKRCDRAVGVGAPPSSIKSRLFAQRWLCCALSTNKPLRTCEQQLAWKHAVVRAEYDDVTYTCRRHI